jgi:hypothetical protein
MAEPLFFYRLNQLLLDGVPLSRWKPGQELSAELTAFLLREKSAKEWKVGRGMELGQHHYLLARFPDELVQRFWLDVRKNKLPVFIPVTGALLVGLPDGSFVRPPGVRGDETLSSAEPIFEPAIPGVAQHLLRETRRRTRR